jgi:ATPase
MEKMFIFRKKSVSQQVKTHARRTLSSQFSKEKRSYVVDTSAVINKFLPRLISKGLRGKIIVPNAVMAELENLANKGREEGFRGLDEIAELHKLKKKYQIDIYFYGLRPTEQQIKFAKSGEIDALIREIAMKTKSALITSDLVQAKSAQAYDLQVVYIRPKEKKKKGFWFWKH